MHPVVRATLVGGWALVLLVSCSKALTPVSPGTDTTAGDAPASAWTSARVREPQTARARLRVVGPVVTLDAAGRPHVERNAEFLVDSDAPEPLDTVPVLAEVKQVRWRVPGGAGNDYVVDSHPERVTLGGVGPKVLHLRAPERAGGGFAEVRLQVNFVPDIWWAGPDPSLFPVSSDGDGRAVDVADWSTFTTVPAWPPDGRDFFGPDSFQFVPPRRLPVGSDPDRRTFYEIWGDRIYARSEGDAVHQGAWLVFVTGGFDGDSPYVPRVEGPAPTLPPGFESQPHRYPVLIDQGLIGSPIGFRLRVPTRRLDGSLLQPSESTTYPNFDASSLYYQPSVAGYWRAEWPGKAYAIARAEDHEGFLNRERVDLIALADRVDAGGGTAEDRLLRRRVLTFQVRPADTTPDASDMAATDAGPGRGARRSR